MPSIVVVVATLVGASPSRMRPPHLPRSLSTIIPSPDTALSVKPSVSLRRVDSARIDVIVIGYIDVPVARIVPPLSTMIDGADWAAVRVVGRA